MGNAVDSIMDFGNRLYVWASVKAAAMKDALKEEKGAVDLIVIVILIAIGIVLALAFKDKITSVLADLFKSVDTNAKKANSEVTYGFAGLRGLF